MMKQGAYIIILMLMLPALVARAQDSDAMLTDGIQFVSEAFVVDSASRTATVTLVLTNKQDKPRELKINVYGTQLVDDERNAYYFSTMELGRVLMRFEDRQNYLHYLLQPDVPVRLTITAGSVSAAATAIQVVKVVFEDSTETGRFLDVYLTDTSTATDSGSADDPSSPSGPSSS